MKRFLLIVFSVAFLFLSCSGITSEDRMDDSSEVVTVMTWNAQTFFDSKVDGTEYSDYQNLAKWSKDKYLTRLGRLCEVLSILDADIVVLEEIENVAVVQDIANQFAGRSWNKSNNWNYSCFAKEPEAAIGCAVLSKYELTDMKVHTMDVQSQKQEQPGVRPIVQITAIVNDKELVIFSNHWKSKSGGSKSSEIWRDWQEFVLSESLNKCFLDKKDLACVMVGDFNRDVQDFICKQNECENSENVIFRGFNSSTEVYTPWISSSGKLVTDIGSYYFNNNWECIDNIFAFGNVLISGFGPKYSGPWAAAGMIPNGYKLYSGEGYSDHLPLMCVLTLV